MAQVPRKQERSLAGAALRMLLAMFVLGLIARLSWQMLKWGWELPQWLL